MMFFSAQDAEGKAKQLNEAGIPCGDCKTGEEADVAVLYQPVHHGHQCAFGK